MNQRKGCGMSCDIGEPTRRMGWKMSCDEGEAMYGFENEADSELTLDHIILF